MFLFLLRKNKTKIKFHSFLFSFLYLNTIEAFYLIEENFLVYKFYIYLKNKLRIKKNHCFIIIKFAIKNKQK